MPSRGFRRGPPRPTAPSSSSSGGGELPPSQPPASAPAGRQPSSDVDIAVEPGPANSRCIWAGVDVGAPGEAVYAALTAYEALDTFIPGLAENRVLERYPDGCRLLQAGRQDLALGVRFSARVCLRITEHPGGMPRRLLARGPNSGSGGGSGSSAWWPFGGASAAIPGYFGGLPGLGKLAGGGSSSSTTTSGYSSSGYSSSRESPSDEEPPAGEFSERRWLRPRSPLGAAPASDISFELLEGDFAAFRGLWRVQGAGPAACRLSYSLFVRPQPWLPVNLVEQRIGREICGNLAAVRAHVEASAAGAQRLPGG